MGVPAFPSPVGEKQGLVGVPASPSPVGEKQASDRAAESVLVEALGSSPAAEALLYCFASCVALSKALIFPNLSFLKKREA